MEEIHRIDKELAELKGQILTEIRHLGHDIKNMMTAMTALMPRAEAERMIAELKEHIRSVEKAVEDKLTAHKEEIEEKFDKVDDEKKFVRRTLFSSILLGVVSWLTWFFKPHS